jgi:hypothetical protein
MTAHDLIASIFSRVQPGVAGNIRNITSAQVDYLRDLIGKDEEGGAVQPGRGRGFAWLPSGRDKYVVAEEPGGDRFTLTRMSNLVASGSGRLFP